MEADPEAKETLRRYEAAIVRRDQALAAAEELERMYREASRDAALQDAAAEEAQRQQSQATLADAEVAAAERTVRAMEMQLAEAELAKSKWAQQINEEVEKFESGKAAALGGVSAVVSSLPLQLLSAEEGLSAALSLAATLACGLLFGITYRYAVRQDVNNSHLRAGVVAAFGLVKGAGGADVLQATSPSGPLSLEVVGVAGLYALECCIVFGFASAAVEWAFRQGLLKRFGEASSSSS